MGFFETWMAQIEPTGPTPIAVVDIETPTGPRTVHITGNQAPADHRQTIEAPDLPDGCPLLGGPVPAGCRFHRKIFKRLLAEGALQAGGSCPLRKVCAL